MAIREKKRSRPRLRWVDQILANLEEVGVRNGKKMPSETIKSAGISGVQSTSDDID